MRIAPRRWLKGQSAVELAIAAPILAVILVVAADYARAFYTGIELDNAARAGAQYGSQSTTTAADTTGIQAAANRDAPNITGMTVTPSYCTCLNPTPAGQTKCASTPINYCANSPAATYVEVDTAANFKMVMNFSTFSNVIKGFGGPSSTIPITGKAIMQVQQ